MPSDFAYGDIFTYGIGTDYIPWWAYGNNLYGGGSYTPVAQSWWYSYVPPAPPAVYIPPVAVPPTVFAPPPPPPPPPPPAAYVPPARYTPAWFANYFIPAAPPPPPPPPAYVPWWEYYTPPPPPPIALPLPPPPPPAPVYVYVAPPPPPPPIPPIATPIPVPVIDVTPPAAYYAPQIPYVAPIAAPITAPQTAASYAAAIPDNPYINPAYVQPAALQQTYPQAAPPPYVAPDYSVPTPTNDSGAEATSVSQEGLQLIIDSEGFTPTPKLNPNTGNYEIGYGTEVTPDQAVAYQNGISTSDAEQLLTSRANDAANFILQNVYVPLSQSQFDALTSLIYNVGVGSVAGSQLLADLNNGDYVAAANEFLNGWDTVNGQFVPGLADRRATEFNLFTVDMPEFDNAGSASYIQPIAAPIIIPIATPVQPLYPAITAAYVQPIAAPIIAPIDGEPSDGSGDYYLQPALDTPLLIPQIVAPLPQAIDEQPSGQYYVYGFNQIQQYYGAGEGGQYSPIHIPKITTPGNQVSKPLPGGQPVVTKPKPAPIIKPITIVPAKPATPVPVTTKPAGPTQTQTPGRPRPISTGLAPVTSSNLPPGAGGGASSAAPWTIVGPSDELLYLGLGLAALFMISKR